MYSSETTWSHVPRAKIRQWIHNKDVGQLQQMVLQNQGSRLLGETASSAAVRQFIQSIPGIMKMIQTTHSAAIGGDLAYFLRESFSSDILESRDRFGRTVLHKAISLGYEDLARHLIIYSRNLINFQDSDGRTPSHFCGLLSTREKRRSMLETLAQSGADLDILDKYGKRAEYYVMAPKAISPFGLSDLPEGPRNGGIRPTLKKASSLPPTAHTTAYSAPRDVGRSITVHPGRLKPIGTINDQTVGKIPKDNGRLLRSLVLILSEGRSHALNMIGAENEEYYPGEFLRDISLHAERIDALHSASSRGKLSRVRSIIESIGSIPTLKDSTDIFAKCRNSTKATPLHQAAVNSHVDIVKYLLGLTPDAIHLLDMDGRTPLHYAALGRNRESSTRIYKILVDFGADEAIRDKAGRLAKDYLQFNESVDKNKLKIPTCFPTFQYSLQDGDEHANSTRFLATSTFDEFRAKRVNLHDGSYMKRVPTQPNEEDSLVDGGQLNIEESNKLASPPLGEMQEGKHGETEKNYHLSHHLQQHLGEMLPVIQEMNTSSTSNEEQNLNSAISSQKEEEFKNYSMVLECQPSKQQPDESSEKVNSFHKVGAPETPVIPSNKFIDDDSEANKDEEASEIEELVSESLERTKNSAMKSKEDLVNLSDEVASWSVNIAKDRKESTKAADEESSVLIGSQLNKLKDTVPDGVETLKMTVASAGDAPTTRLEKTSEATTNGISKAIVSAAVPLARLFERNKDYVYSCDQANEQLSLGPRKSQNKANFEEETNKINENDEKSSIFRKMDDFLFRRKNRNGSNTERLKKAGIISEIFGYQNLGKEEESKALKRWMGLGKDPKSLRNITRDINGNTDLHFAVKDFSGRIPEILSHRNSSFFVVARNLNYKTARDMAKEIGNEKSVIEIDSYVIGLVKKGEIDSLTNLFMEGYDHVSDIVDPESGRNIMTVAEEEGNRKSVLFLRGLVNYEENRNIIHTSIRLGQLDRLKVLLNNKRKGKLFAVAKDKKGRCSLHVAVLAMHLHKLEMINYLCREFPYTVAVQDNLGRTPLHYAYGLGEDSEEVIYILEAVGAKNSVPDYLQRTPLDFSELQSEIYKLAKEEQDEI